MWPFKGKKSESAAMSGIITCDGKHHHWTAWKDVIITRTSVRPWLKEPLICEVNGQERTCIFCNYLERREIKGD